MFNLDLTKITFPIILLGLVVYIFFILIEMLIVWIFCNDDFEISLRLFWFLFFFPYGAAFVIASHI